MRSEDQPTSVNLVERGTEPGTLGRIARDAEWLAAGHLMDGWAGYLLQDYAPRRRTTCESFFGGRLAACRGFGLNVRLRRYLTVRYGWGAR